MSQAPAPSQADETVVLKDPGIAALLAWVLPGLGHVYQGRTAKGVLFFVCLFGLFTYGVCLGGNGELGYGRAVYVAWNDEDQRLPYLCQVFIGLPAMPALVQANRVGRGEAPRWGGFMAPPAQRRDDPRAPGRAAAVPAQPTLDDLHARLAWRFDLGTLFTELAGLLNILAIFDAWGGPVFPQPKKRREDSPEEEGASAPAKK